MVCLFASFVGRDSAVGIATRYGLDGPVIKLRWGAKFSAPVQTGAGAHPVSYTMGTESISQGVKWPGRGVDHPPPSSPSGPSWPVLGWTLPFTLPSSGGGYKNYNSPTLCYHPPSSLSRHLFRYNFKFRIVTIFVTRGAGEVQGVCLHHLWIWIFNDLITQTTKILQNKTKLQIVLIILVEGLIHNVN
jgi:hypothetical protein